MSETPTPHDAALVYDRWWPWRLGRLLKRTKASAVVQWLDGEVWRYDRAHLQFLVEDTR